MFSVLEVAVRRMALPDPELIEYMDRVLENPAELTYYATRPSDFRQFGWDSKQDIYFPSEEALDETPRSASRPYCRRFGDPREGRRRR